MLRPIIRKFAAPRLGPAGGRDRRIWNDFRYKVFVSYTHHDKKWGEWLEQQLEAYRVPDELRGKWTPFGPVPNNLRPVCRDRTVMGAAPNLPEAVRSRLEDSGTLVVVCSPAAAQHSPWVDDEVKYYQSLGRADRIFALIVDGNPNGAPHEQCFPPAIRELGTLAADARPDKDGKHGALIKLIAGILGVDFSDLQQKENDVERERSQRARLTAMAMGLLAVVAVVSSLFAFNSLAVTEAAKTKAVNAERMADDLRVKTQEQLDARVDLIRRTASRISRLQTLHSEIARRSEFEAFSVRLGAILSDFRKDYDYEVSDARKTAERYRVAINLANGDTSTPKVSPSQGSESALPTSSEAAAGAATNQSASQPSGSGPGLPTDMNYGLDRVDQAAIDNYSAPLSVYEDRFKVVSVSFKKPGATQSERVQYVTRTAQLAWRYTDAGRFKDATQTLRVVTPDLFNISSAGGTEALEISRSLWMRTSARLARIEGSMERSLSILKTLSPFVASMESRYPDSVDTAREKFLFKYAEYSTLSAKGSDSAASAVLELACEHAKRWFEKDANRSNQILIADYALCEVESARKTKDNAKAMRRLNSIAAVLEASVFGKGNVYDELFEILAWNYRLRKDRLSFETQAVEIDTTLERSARVWMRAIARPDFLPRWPSEARDLLSDIKARFDKTKKDKLAFYIAGAKAFSAAALGSDRSQSYEFVSGMFALMAGQIEQSQDNHARASELLATAVRDLHDSIGSNLPDTFSDDYAALSEAYLASIRSLGKLGNLQRAASVFGQFRKRGQNYLSSKYDYDFYFRANLLSAYELMGDLFFASKRYDEALPILRSASHWGVGASTETLARMYRDGIGVPRDTLEADRYSKLATRQTMKRFTIPATFGAEKHPFFVYVREWPPLCSKDNAAPRAGEFGCYPYEGIDDQVRWLKEARGGDIPKDVIVSFQKLHRIARENNVSFPELCVYALGAAREDTFDKILEGAKKEFAATPDQLVSKLYAKLTSANDTESQWRLLSHGAREARTLAAQNQADRARVWTTQVLDLLPDLKGRTKEQEQFARESAVLLDLAAAYIKLRDFDKAKPIVRQAEAAARQAHSKRWITDAILAERLTSVSWHAVFTRDFDLVLTASRDAYQFGGQKDITPLGNEAHALLLTGRLAEAKQVYFDHVGQKLEDGRDWVDAMLVDFEELKSAGLAVPEMDLIARELVERKTAIGK